MIYISEEKVPYKKSCFLHQVLEFPEDDIEVNLVPRKIRTEDHIVPEEPYSQV